MKSPVRKVTRNVGMNPVARAVARQQMRRLITDMRIALFLLDDGADFAPYLNATWVPVFALLTAMDVQGQSDTVDARKLKGAMSLLDSLREDATWSKDHVITIDNALQILLDRWHELPAELANGTTRFAQGSFQ